MFIKIKKNAANIYRNNQARQHQPTNFEWIKTLEAIAGQTLEVDTDYLFKDQFNTKLTTFIKDGQTYNIPGLRILDFPDEESIVEEVIDDIRYKYVKCTYCGKMSEKAYILLNPKLQFQCPHCNQLDTVEDVKPFYRPNEDKYDKKEVR